MLLTVCILILIYSILQKPVGGLVSKLKGVNWKKITSDAWDKIVSAYKRIGRSASRYALLFYYTLAEGNLTTLDKALLYAGIAYVVIPGDLLPRKILGMLGVIDDAAIAAWIYNKVKKNRCLLNKIWELEILCKYKESGVRFLLQLTQMGLIIKSIYLIKKSIEYFKQVI